MTQAPSPPLGAFPSGSGWHLPAGTELRQAVAPLRGYAYQLHESLAAWMALSDGAELHLEVAEDYATIARNPTELQEVLTVTQVKDTRESGKVTLNSRDVLDAIQNFWDLHEANPSRPVRLIFLTTSDIGLERDNRLPSRSPGLEAWGAAGNDDNVSEIRAALQLRFPDGTLGAFLRAADDRALCDQLLRNVVFACGALDYRSLESANRRELVARRDEVSATEDRAALAYDNLLAAVLDTIVTSPSRRLTRDDFLVRFRAATSVPVPSQTYMDLTARLATDRSKPSPPIQEEDLRRVAKRLLETGSPPSLLPLFPTASSAVRAALDHLTGVPRHVVSDGGGKRTTARIAQVFSEKGSRLHLVIAPPGSGKTHALWHAASDLLRDPGNLVPLYLPLGELATWSDALDLIAHAAGSIDPQALLGDARACIILDGWSEFASRQTAERAKALRALGQARVVADARRATEADALFDSWTLEPLPIASVREVVRIALPNVALHDAALLELLRLPLALALFILLGSSITTRGELLSALHTRLSSDLPDGFWAVLAGAVAAVGLSGGRSFGRLEQELSSRAVRAAIQEPVKLLARLGTLENRLGQVQPIHDLYWSWLNGSGLLLEDRLSAAFPDLLARESYQLAVEAGVRSTPKMIEEACGCDVVLAALLIGGLEVPLASNDAFRATVESMFTDTRLPVRSRAAVAGFRSRDGSLIRRSLDIVTELFNTGIYLPTLWSAVTAQGLFPHRDSIAEWVRGKESDLLIEVIAKEGGSEWLPWLEQLAHAGKLRPQLAAATAVACTASIPAWAEPHLRQLVETESWKLRAAASRGANTALARWIVDHYGDFDQATRGGIWLDLNRIIISCGNEEIFQRLLDRFPRLSVAAQDTVGYAVAELGEPWIARFQTEAFRAAGGKQHHKLAELVSTNIDDATARHWIAVGHYQLGWRVLIERHGAAVLPELLAELPDSFDGLHDIPALAVMRFLPDAPDWLAHEIFRRIRGGMQPKATQDAINAIARVRPNGLQYLTQWVTSNPQLLPTYFVRQILHLVKTWERDVGFRVMISTPSGGAVFSEWILTARLPHEKRDRFFQEALAQEPRLVIRAIMHDLREEPEQAASLLGHVKALPYDPDLFAHLVATPELAGFIPKLFAGTIDTIPETALLQAIATSGDKFDELTRALAASSTTAHRNLHAEVVRRALSEDLNLFRFRSIAAMLRPHPRAMLLDFLKSRVSPGVEKDMWLVREIEIARGELLIDETGAWLD